MDIAGDLALQTKIKWPLHEDELARLLHLLCESGDGTEADVAKLRLGYRKTKCGNLSFKNILREWKLVLRVKRNMRYKDYSYRLLFWYDAAFLYLIEDMALSCLRGLRSMGEVR